MGTERDDEAGPAGPGRGGVDPVEDLVAECIRRHAEEGDAAIDRLCAEHPGSSAEVRARLEALRRIGMFDEDARLPSFPGYRTVRVLGQGGMGVVYLAIDQRLGRPVALKLLRKGMEADRRARERFLREVRAVARTTHPGIVTVLDVGEVDGSAYFTMEFVEGVTLADVLVELRARRDGGFPSAAELRERVGAFPGDGWLEAVCRWVVDVARALDHVHEAGILHRDVKPSNVLIGRDGRARLLDFGLASLDEDPTLTLSGDFLGTPHYVSPEQVRGDASAIDRRTDVYSLGVTLYELLTFHAPFQGPSTRHVFREIEEGRPIPPRSHEPAIPADVEIVCRTAMAPDRERRYRTAGVLADDLERYLAGRPIEARAPSLLYRTSRYVRRNRVQVASAALVLLALASGLLVATRALGHAGRAAGLAERRLAETERLADVLLFRELVAEAETLYPLDAEVAPRMEDWLRRTDELLERREVHRAFLASWRAEHGIEDEPMDDERLEAVPLEERWRARTTVELLEGCEALADLREDVARRHAFASTVEARTLVEPAAEWSAAIEAIEGRPAYDGLRIAPQSGLVPLGADPGSGLQEFWHVQSGSRPGRDPASGRVVCGEESGVVLVLIPGGVFEMGAVPPDDPQVETTWNVDPAAERRERPVHEVRLEPFFLSKFELTQGQWLRLTGANPSFYNPGLENPGGRPTLAHPVESIGWSEAERWLGRAGLSIPTEAQWEYAARAGTTTPWYTGEEARSIAGHVNVGDRTAASAGAPASWGLEPWLTDGAVVHAPVGSYLPNAFGLHDVMGNVAEWCRDKFAFYDEQPAAGPQGERFGGAQGEDRIQRGGSFGVPASRVRVSERTSGLPDARTEALGVRPARRIDP